MRQMLTAVVLAVALGSAQEATLLVEIPQQQRQGVYQTGTFVVPAAMTGYIRVLATMSDVDRQDPALSAWIRIYAFDETTQTWVLAGGGRWTGDPTIPPGALVGIAVRVDGLRGKQIRGEIDIPVRLRVGCVVDNVQSLF